MWQVKSIWLIVNVELLCIPLLLPLLAGGIITVFGEKRQNYVLCQEGCTICSFTQARTDWQLSLAEALLITCIDQSIGTVVWEWHHLPKQTRPIG